MAIYIKPFKSFVDLLHGRLGYFALMGFLLETSVLSWSIKRRMTLQEIENKDRISIGLANYSLK